MGLWLKKSYGDCLSLHLYNTRMVALLLKLVCGITQDCKTLEQSLHFPTWNTVSMLRLCFRMAEGKDNLD